MSDFDAESFFTLHADLPREGPGETADVAWAAEVAGLRPDARVLDAASGPGGDLGALLRAAPEGHVTAIDLHAPFIDAARARWGKDKRVTLEVGDMTAPRGPFDLIWCAGAVYFLGVEAALSAWRGALADGGVVAFSEPCYFTDPPSDGARAFWQGEGVQVMGEDGIRARIAAAGFETLATRPLSDIAWESYYRPVMARVEELRPSAPPALAKVLAETQAEYDAWRANRAETGYLLCVVRPVAPGR
jgi:SAM-dependent methyltransferase